MMLCGPEVVRCPGLICTNQSQEKRPILLNKTFFFFNSSLQYKANSIAVDTMLFCFLKIEGKRVRYYLEDDLVTVELNYRRLK